MSRRQERAIERLVNALTEYYQTWLRMSSLDEDLLVEAPQHGHDLPAEMTTILAQHKTPQVAGLLKRLPFVTGQDPSTPLTYNTRLIDYWHTDQILFWPHEVYRPIYNTALDGTFPPTVEPYELPLARGDGEVGVTVVIDTSSDELTARVYAAANDAPLCKQHDDDKCSEFCRGRSLKTVPAVELINQYTLDLLELRSMSIGNELYDPDWDDPLERYKEAFETCGWPDAFDPQRFKTIVSAKDFHDDRSSDDSEDSETSA